MLFNEQQSSTATRQLDGPTNNSSHKGDQLLNNRSVECATEEPASALYRASIVSITNKLLLLQKEKKR